MDEEDYLPLNNTTNLTNNTQKVTTVAISDHDLEQMTLCQIKLTQEEKTLLSNYENLDNDKQKELATLFGIKTSIKVSQIKMQLSYIYNWYYNNKLTDNYIDGFNQTIKSVFKGV